jgi:preprotein translocase subunit YajC
MANSHNMASVSKNAVVVVVVVIVMVILIGIAFFLIRRHQKNYKFSIQEFDKIMKKKYVDF